MRIGVDARPLTVPTFGIGRYTSELLTRLFELGKEHHWYLYADRPLDYSVPRNVSIREFPSHQPLLSLARTQLSFAAWSKRDKLDVFWSPRHHLPLFMDVPCVLTIHDLVWKKFPETMKPANLFVEKLLMPASVRLASAIIAVSKSTAEDIQHCFQSSPEAIKLVYEAAELDQRLNLQREISDPYFLFVGTNEPRKNLARLLEGYDQYRKSGGSLRLVIAGSVGWGEETRPAESVKILGYVDDHRLDGLIRFSTALLLPSLYEGFGLPILEALQRGVPVITSNVSSMPELAGEAGILVNPLVSAELSDAMARMSDSNLRDAYAKQSLSQASKFSWENAAKETLSIILETAA